jgi:OOP family OmpA-OmpF porin
MLSWKRAILPVLALALFAAPALADGDRGDWEVGFYTGYAFLDDYDRAFPQSSFDLDNDFVIGLRGGYWFTPRWSSELSFQTVGTETSAGLDADIDSYRLNALANFNEGARMRPFITVGLGDEHLEMTGLSGARNPSWNAGGGFRAWVLEDMAVRVDFRYIWADHENAVNGDQNNLETTVGLTWAWGGGKPMDSDGDGVVDRKDRCPDTPRGATVDAMGCPSDGDKDGVYDGIDKCPDTPAGHEVDNRGCSMDSDGDGVHDGPDKCADTPSGATVDADGCPKDSDGDGVYDGIDKCADTPKGVTVDSRGCPKDSDGDGVYDGLDKCPNTEKGAKVDAKGCAIPFESEEQALVLRNILFEFNSATLTDASKQVLDIMAVPLSQSNATLRFEVAGHTDSVGSDAYNLKLSQRRAESVVNHLVASGLGRSRLEAKGFGETKPVDTNDTADGRANNRRVELRQLD